MQPICGSECVINGLITYKKLNVIRDPLVVYDINEWILYTNSENIKEIHEKCLLITEKPHKSFKYITINELLDDIANNLNIINMDKSKYQSYENPYYFCLKYKFGYYNNKVSNDIHKPNKIYEIPSYFFTKMNELKFKKNNKNLMILNYLYHNFKKTGCKYLGYYYALLESMDI
jgi:hypothetical protein